MRNVLAAPPTKMTTHIPDRSFTALSASGLVVGVAALIIGVLFAGEGLLGYYYNASLFLEGLDHMWEIFGGVALAAVGAILGAYAVLRR